MVTLLSRFPVVVTLAFSQPQVPSLITFSIWKKREVPQLGHFGPSVRKGYPCRGGVAVETAGVFRDLRALIS